MSRTERNDDKIVREQTRAVLERCADINVDGVVAAVENIS